MSISQLNYEAPENSTEVLVGYIIRHVLYTDRGEK